MKRYPWLGAITLALLGCGDEFIERELPEAGASDSAASLGDVRLLPACGTQRIKVVIVSPGGLKVGSSTRIEAQVIEPPAAEQSQLSWWLQREGVNAAEGVLRPGVACETTATTCARFTCTGASDGDANMNGSGLWVTVKYESTSCFDIVRLPIVCLPTVTVAVDGGTSD